MEWFILWLAFSLIPAVLASKRGRSGVGWFFLSLLISPLLAAILVVAFEDLSKKQCSTCGATIPVQAQVCPFCKKDLAVMVSSTSEFKPDSLTKKCPDCAETIKLEAVVCRFCGHKYGSAEVQAAIQEAQSEFQAELENAKEKENAKRAASACPKCNSTNTAWEGWWEGRACRDCGHKWVPGMF